MMRDALLRITDVLLPCSSRKLKVTAVDFFCRGVDLAKDWLGHAVAETGRNRKKRETVFPRLQPSHDCHMDMEIRFLWSTHAAGRERKCS